MPHISKWKRRRIIAWDGEGVTLESGEHVYNLLANSNGWHIINHSGLSTQQCFEFCMKNNDVLATHIIFGGSYDVNMMLRDVPLEQLAELWATGDVEWGGWRIHFRPRKLFTLHRLDRPKDKGFTLWDVFGFYQSSFVAACRKWLGESEVLDTIENMKLQRSVFSAEDIENIVKYNATECNLLVQIFDVLLDALDEAGIMLSRYDGAGAIAAALMAKYHVKDHKGITPSHINRLAQRAYSGGRIEAVKIGNYEGKVWRYDINSAYPATIIGLPDYTDARWVELDTEQILDGDLVEVEWSLPDDVPFYPLWYREANGNIVYPKEGSGTYFGVEVQGLIRHWDPSCFHILRVWRATNLKPYHPFSFVGEIYDQRLEFQRRGSMAQEAIKLGMNSLYGKMVQQEGFRGGRIPIYHQLLWGAYVTAATRAELFRTAMQKPESVIAFATDAVFSTQPLAVEQGHGLGEWTAERFDGMTIAQAGVYWLGRYELVERETHRVHAMSWQAKYRGFDKGSLSREAICVAWSRGEHEHTATLTRFVGLGGALNTTDFHRHWRTWPTMNRTLEIWPTGKRIPGVDTCYAERLCATVAAEAQDPSMPSAPYPVVWLDGTKPLIPTIDTPQGELSVRVLEAEEDDSYA